MIDEVAQVLAVVSEEKGMGTATETKPKWTSREAYLLAVLCVLVGIPVGYLFHAPPAGRVNSSAPAVPLPNPAAANPSQVPPEQRAHMADKQAEPLLAELKTNPNDASVLAKVGNIYLAAQQPKNAQTYYERSLAVKAKDANVLTQLASSYYYQGDADKAIMTLQRALKVDPGFANALFNLGMIEWQEKADANGAIALWEKLLRSNPDHPKRAQVEQLIAKAKRHVSVPGEKKTDKPQMQTGTAHSGG
ncbi:MAG: tetratricopeptide repeat protein [Terriglobales bacterium]